MCCRLTPCEQWKQERRGYVPTDIYNAQNYDSCYRTNCNCNCGCNYNGCCEENTENTSDTDCC